VFPPQFKNSSATKSSIPVRSEILPLNTFKEVMVFIFDVGTEPLVGPASYPKLINANSKLTSGTFVNCALEMKIHVKKK
jgi:hypothetical protein